MATTGIFKLTDTYNQQQQGGWPTSARGTEISCFSFSNLISNVAYTAVTGNTNVSVNVYLTSNFGQTFNFSKPITYYVTANATGLPNITVATQSNVVVFNNLTKGNVYNFYVLPITATANSIPTGTQNVLAPVYTLPTSPINVSASAINYGSASVTFTPPADTGGNASITYTAISTPGCISATGTAPSITVPGLTGSTNYTFRVIATNSANLAANATTNQITTPAHPPLASGGSVSTSGNYRIHTFPSSGCLVVQYAGTFEYLIVAGGGGGGAFYAGFPASVGGGGGGGGVVTGSTPVSASTYSVVVGGGGSGSGAWIAAPNAGQRGGTGSASSIFGATANGGGGGGGSPAAGNKIGGCGGSGGGGGGGPAAGAGGGGNQGGAGGAGSSSIYGGGGGGAGGLGVGPPYLSAPFPANRPACMTKSVGGAHGGNGVISCIQGPGANLTIGGGGGAGSTPGGSSGNQVASGTILVGGGLYGGGKGASSSTPATFNATAGACTQGGGGGGDGRGTSGGASGGSGLVIVRYIYQ